MARNRKRGKDQQAGGSMSASNTARKYLMVVLGLVVIGGIAWFAFLLPEVSAQNQMEAQCKTICNEIHNNTGVVKDSKALEYCTKAFDLGGVEVVEGEKQDYCSDGAHCFNKYECTYKARDLDVSNCIDIIYDHYTEYNNEDSQRAAQHVVDVYSPSNNKTGVGTCNLDASWYDNKLSEASDVLSVVER